MLSNQAWNALLKTLEEPPAHVKFLFATTEVHKILPTVLSRCQRFDLRRIPENLIVEKLIEIVKDEGVKVSLNAIRAVARAADGGMRDALSLMDQMMAFHLSEVDGEITEEQILSTFGLTAPDKIYNLVKAILYNQQSEVVTAINEQAIEGKNLESLFQDILKYLRGIEICMLVSEPDSILEVGTDIIERYKQLGIGIQLHVVQKLLEALSSSGKVLHDAINKQIYIETLLLKAMRLSRSKRIEDLLEKINILRKAGKFKDLEIEIPAFAEKKKINEEIPSSIVPKIKSKKVEVPSPVVIVNETDYETERSQKKEKVYVSDDSPAFEKKSSKVLNKVEAFEPVQKIEPAVEPIKTENAVIEQKIKSDFSVEKQIVKAEKPHDIKVESAIETPSETNIVPEKNIQQVEVQPPKTFVSESPEKLWHKLIVDMDHINQPQLKFYLQEAKPRSVDNNSITVVYDEEFGTVPAHRVNQEKDVLNKCLQRITGIRNFKITVIKEKGISTPRHSIEKVDLEEVKSKVEGNPFVKETIKVFNGRIVDFRG
jgi:DNA polymerase III subunit gamma/tau